ncbi:thioesterase domain-containing protein [Bacillus wiedmannii]|uniref:thioesterase II family protein n=1 Tax=Bacillus wiedmannii TaxID=1890302 RepID=UPI0021D17393|nr:thioesterase domain-containing protein [Bacillus wiedmannii]MCU5680699.1 thioesterase domain-containing protein [Bacillus wiedmannii]
MEKIKLFCLPYAGGSASMYYQLKGYMHKIVDVIPIEYSGHGERISENYYASFKNMVDDIASKIIDYLDDDQFSILGYSMGSLVALYPIFSGCSGDIEEVIQNELNQLEDLLNKKVESEQFEKVVIKH